MRILMDLDKAYEKSPYAPYHVGDTVDVGVKIPEVVEKSGKGGVEIKERVQLFSGTVIREQGSGPRKTLTVRRIVAGENRTVAMAEDFIRGQGLELQVHDDAECHALLQGYIAAHPEIWNADKGDH